MNVFVLLNFWRKFVTRLFLGTIDFFTRKKKYYRSQWCPRTAVFPTFFRISSFVFSRTKTFIQVWNYLRVSKWWQNFHFWVNYPFNNCCKTDFPNTLFILLCSERKKIKKDKENPATQEHKMSKTMCYMLSLTTYVVFLRTQNKLKD